MRQNNAHFPPYIYICCCLVVMGMLSSCSTTKHIPDGDQLFTGLTKIDYKNYERNQNFFNAQEEVEAALATAPNGALLGSSYLRTPFPYRLWIWNAFAGKESQLSKWIAKSFGKKPVLMSWVNPALRASVAQSVLRKHGYFRGKVDYEIVPQRHPKKSKIGYTVTMNHLFTIDTIRYVNFPLLSDSLIRATEKDAMIHTGDAFTVAALDAERKRLSNMFRNSGYYYYQPSYASYLADTLAVPGKVQLRLQAADGIPDNAKHKWYIGNVTVDLRKQFMQELADSIGRGAFKVRFSGRKPPVRIGVIVNDMKLMHGDPYRYENYLKSTAKLNSTGIFSMVDFSFTPRDTTRTCDTLDLNLNCVFERPYDFYVESKYNNKTSGRTGPELVLGFTKRNAFRGGELLDINLHGSYEWQTSGGLNGSRRFNSYEYGVDVSVQFPRLMLPWQEWLFRKTKKNKEKALRRFINQMSYYSAPSTIAKVSRTSLNRPDYFKLVNFSGEWTYRWQKTQNSKHELSPLAVTYQHLLHATETYDSILNANPYLGITMHDVFIPKMRYSYYYNSPAHLKNPISWEITVTESGNIASLGYLAFGKKWNSKNKEMFKNSYAQFFKIETDFTKKWRLGLNKYLVGHVNAGIICTYGNSEEAPYSELFYVGGANSIRAFTVRSIGPGKYVAPNAMLAYLDQTGDMRLLMNLEYRQKLFNNVYAAAFLDAGNVWAMKDDVYREDAKFKFANILKEMAVGTGIGFRYDLDFLVLRLDWGVGLHVPYDTGKSGYFNIRSFKEGQSLHLAVGYPF
ncbi:MAG: BamA/TamA family outer membrane protein [Prevotellaceae bacterium]|nr:BamA/TamA family outer membrane protein [Prevotella sp.]MDD7258206.1 BamA/TamA family outer membrane protein [Prevotellaceae bacterium]